MGQLLELTDAAVTTRHSEGMESRARILAARCGLAQAHLKGLFGFNPEVTLFVLSRRDWSEHADEPVYALPHYQNRRLIVGAEPGDFWRSLADIVDNAHGARRAELASVYGVTDGRTDLTRLFDLVVVHELGHAFQFQGGRSFPRSWLAELFANLCMHSYVTGCEPDELQALQLVCELLLDAGHSFRHRTLSDFERLYTDVGPENYVWYQFRLMRVAERVYQKAGDEALRRMWRSFHLGDDELAMRLRTDVDPVLADLISGWERE